MAHAETAHRSTFSYAVAMCFGIVPPNMELLVSVGWKRDIMRIGQFLWTDNSHVTENNNALASACRMPDVIEALGLRNSTLILGVVYFERFERRLGHDLRTMTCLDWRIRFPVVFVCLLLAAKFTEDDNTKDLVKRLASVLARIEGIDIDACLVMLRRLELVVLETIDYDCGVPDDLCEEETKNPAFVISWIVATLVHNGVVESEALSAPYPRQIEWLESVSRLPVARDINQLTSKEINNRAADLAPHRQQLVTALRTTSIRHLCKCLFFICTKRPASEISSLRSPPGRILAVFAIASVVLSFEHAVRASPKRTQVPCRSSGRGSTESSCPWCCTP